MIDELEDALLDLVPRLEGLRDYSRLNLDPAAQAEVQPLLADYVDREAKLNAALQSLQALQGDGYPGVLTRQVSEAVHNDLRVNRETIATAFDLFNPAPTAVTGSVVFTPNGG
jgi:hypothetical protein